MATFSFTIPDTVAPTMINALRANAGLGAVFLTDKQVVQQFVRAALKPVVRDYVVSEATKKAAVAVNDALDTARKTLADAESKAASEFDAGWAN